MALLIQEVREEPRYSGCGCVAILLPLGIIVLFADSIINGIISFVSGLITVSLWLLGLVAIVVIGFYLIKYLIEWIKDRNI